MANGTATMDASEQPAPPRPALPILASSLLAAEERRGTAFSIECGERVSTRCGQLDELLGGGFERGTVVGLSQTDEMASAQAQLV